MGFEKFGQSGYVSQAKVIPLISFLEKGIVSGTRCKKCGQSYFPPRADCLACRSSDVEWVPIEGRPKLVTYTQVFFGPPAFEQSTPYLLGLAEFANGLRVFAPISREFDPKQLRPGLEMDLKPRHTGEGVYYQLEKPD